MVDERNASEDRLLLALTTEHFNLQTARASTIAESNGRVLIFLSTLSSSLVALAFVGQSTVFGTPFYAFTFTILPANLIIGMATYMRALQITVEDVIYSLAINRIRAHYTTLHPDAESLLLIPTAASFRAIRAESLGEKRPSRLQPLFSVTGMVACLVGLIAGALAALIVIRLFDNSGVVAVALGIVTAATIVTWLAYNIRRHVLAAMASVGLESPFKNRPQPNP